jgi:hypothetical protein
LYNLKEDIGEEVNLVEARPEKAAELLKVLEEWRANTNAPVPSQLNPEFIPPG